MARKLDKIIIVDIESSCWEGKPPKGQVSEIIEVGICILDVLNGDITENQGIIIKPERSCISDFCTSLTTLTQDQVDKGITFKEACTIIRKEYSAQSRAWGSFGAYDIKMFKKQCQEVNVGYPFGPSHINIKTLFALLTQRHSETGMSGALNELNIELEGIHHRGIDDAKNIAKIMWHLISNFNK